MIHSKRYYYDTVAQTIFRIPAVTLSIQITIEFRDFRRPLVKYWVIAPYMIFIF